MPQQLRFRADGSFTIVYFTDIHWTDGGADDRQSARLMSMVLDAEQPDLVIYGGDVIHGADAPDPAGAWRAAVAPAVTRNLPWAAVFGNHDDEGSMDRAALMAMQRAIPGCLSEPGPETVFGVGNYRLPVWDDAGQAVMAHLYCMDSNSYAETDVGGYGWFQRDQIAWYLAQAAAAAQDGEPLPALAFFHIPLSEYNEVWDLHPCRGVKGEAVCCPLVNSGMFAAMHEAGEIMATFVGHDHLNDFIGELYGIHLAFGRASGYGGYGDDAFARGARVVRLHAGERRFSSWLRLADGVALREQPLHEPEVKRKTCIL